MAEQLIIDGNNLLHLMHAYAMGRPVGRLHMAGMIDRYAARKGQRVTLVFDGPPPRGGIAGQFAALGIHIIFSGRRTADDIILQMVERVPDPASATVVSSDRAIQDGAKRRKLDVLASENFAGLLLASQRPAPPSASPPIAGAPRVSEDQKPPAPASNEADAWMRELWGDEDLPDDWQLG